MTTRDPLEMTTTEIDAELRESNQERTELIFRYTTSRSARTRAACKARSEELAARAADLIAARQLLAS